MTRTPAPARTTTAGPSASQLAARLRFRHLQLLLALQQGGSLRAAAQTMNLTQPALSKALGEIEAAFGCTLFDRNPRGLLPTARGAVVLRGAGRLLQELAHVQREAVTGERVTEVVRIGAPPFVAHGQLPAVLAALLRSEPPVRAELMEERVPLLLQALAEGRLDALVTSYPAQMPDSLGVALRYEQLFEAEFHVIAPVGHPAAKARRTDWKTIAGYDWIMPGRASMVRRHLDETFIRAGCVAPVPVLESTSPVTNVQLVAAGIGLSTVPAITLQQALVTKKVVRVPVMPPLARNPVALISRSEPDNPRVARLRLALAVPRG